MPEFFGEAEQAEAKPESEASSVHDFDPSEVVACGPDTASRHRTIIGPREGDGYAAATPFWPRISARFSRSGLAASFMYSSCTEVMQQRPSAASDSAMGFRRFRFRQEFADARRRAIADVGGHLVVGKAEARAERRVGSFG